MKKQLATLVVLVGSLAAFSGYAQVSHPSGPALAPPNNNSSTDPVPSPTLHPHDPTPPPSTPRESPTHRVPVLNSSEAAIIPGETPVAVGSPSLSPLPPSPGPTRFIPDPHGSALKQAADVTPVASPYPTIPFEPAVPPRDPTTSTLKTAPADNTSPNFTAPHIVPPATKHAIDTKGTGTDKRQVTNPNGPLPTPYPSPRHFPAPRPTPRHSPGTPIKAELPPSSSLRTTKRSRRDAPYAGPTPRPSPGSPVKIQPPPHSALRRRGPTPTPAPR